MDRVEIVSFIKTTLLRRGDGTEYNPVRIITQYWTMDGELAIEIDPNDENKMTVNFKSSLGTNVVDEPKKLKI